jgi:hypothetical protein
MLPRMDTLKRAIFTHRISVYNESFVELGKGGLVFACLWDESVSGRKYHNLLSAIHKFCTHNSEKDSITFFFDNCNSQNKNWNLLSHMALLINCNFLMKATESITFKFLEPGHTFMSADSFHASVENSMFKAQKLYTFNDFVQCVKSSRKTEPTVFKMATTDFF